MLSTLSSTMRPNCKKMRLKSQPVMPYSSGEILDKLKLPKDNDEAKDELEVMEIGVEEGESIGPITDRI